MTTVNIPDFLTAWHATLQPAQLPDIVTDPATTAEFSADMVNGFLRFGPLASSRVDAIAAPVVSLVQRAHDLGVREFAFLQDTHDPATAEFEVYPAHCLAGTPESAMIPDLARLPFRNEFTVIPKNSLDPAIGTRFGAWLDEHPDLRTAIVVGDCTDLCTYQLAMHLRLRANALNLSGYRVIVPEDCVNTFDTPSHPGDFFHLTFLYQMANNGVDVVRSLT